MSRPRAEMMPAVAVPPRPNGLPIASTQSPTRARPSRRTPRAARPVALDLDHREVRLRVVTDERRIELAAVMQS